MASCGPPCDFGDRLGDIGIGAAAADVTAHSLAQFSVAELRRHIEVLGHMARDAGFNLVEYRDRRGDLAWRAIAALKTVADAKSGLHRMLALWSTQALNGGYFIPLLHDRQREQRIDAPAVDND